MVDLAGGAIHPQHQEYLPTPIPATPEAVAVTVADAIASWRTPGPVGIALPCVVADGTIRTATNIPAEWIGINAERLFGDALSGRRVVVLNDADAAALAEARNGAARHAGNVLLLSLGTGVGSAVLRDGKLQPNSSFGQVVVDGNVADRYVSLASRLSERLTWADWADRMNRFLRVIEDQEQFDLIVIGGSLAHESVHWEGRLVARAPLVRARFFNMASVVGAALAAE